MLRRLGIVTAAAILAAGAAIGSDFGSHALADHVNQTQCFPDTGPPQTCITADGATNSTSTPSGNQIYMFNGTMTYTVIDSSGNVVYTETDQVHSHTLFDKNGSLKEGGEHLSFTYSPGPGGGTCTATVAFHQTANGIQYDNFSQSGDCF